MLRFKTNLRAGRRCIWVYNSRVKLRMENLIPALVRSWAEKGVRIINKRKRTQRKSGLSMTTWLVGGGSEETGECVDELL